MQYKELSNKRIMEEIHYNVEVEVKYKNIEMDLMGKCDKEDLDEMILSLYTLELSKVMGIEDGSSYFGKQEEERTDLVLVQLWQHISKYEPFLVAFEKFKQNNFKNFFIDVLDDVIFTTMFHIDLFYLIHPCIVEFIRTGNIQNETLNALIEKC